MEISEEQRELLKKRWQENGDCHSCGWHNAYYEVQEYIEDAVHENRIEKDGSIYVPCFANNGEDNDDHRGSYIYNWNLEDVKKQEEEKKKGWISIYDDVPTYYKSYLCKNHEGKIALCWRASNGDEDIYTICQSDDIFENVLFWKDIQEHIN